MIVGNVTSQTGVCHMLFAVSVSFLRKIEMNWPCILVLMVLKMF